MKPAFFRSLSVANLPTDSCRLTLIGLFTFCDDYGRGVDDARLVKGEIWALDDRYTAKKVEVHLASIAEEGTICRYVIDGRRYLHFPKWSSHQKISHPTDSEIPACPIHDTPESHGGDQEDSGITPEPLPNETGADPLGREGKGIRKGREGTSPPADTDEVSDPEADRLCNLLADLIEANGSKRPTITKAWRTDCDRLMRIDGRTSEQIERAIRWCQEDEFWRANVMSMTKLREKYDQLRLQAKRPAHLAVVGEQKPDPIDEYQRIYGQPEGA